MTKIYLFRHGEVYNPDNVLYGRLPGFHLSEAGKAGVRKSAGQLPIGSIKKIYTSPLDRAVETSEIIRDTLGLSAEDVIIHEELIEVDCKFWEGKPLEEFLKESQYLEDPEHQTDTENILHAGKRVLDVINEVAEQKVDAVVVSHGDPIAGTLVSITGDWDEFHKRYLDRGTYVVIEHKNGRWRLAR